ncbi:MAG: hypothetical protein ACRCX2_23230 [Paraclostridium sp.]
MIKFLGIVILISILTFITNEISTYLIGIKINKVILMSLSIILSYIIYSYCK